MFLPKYIFLPILKSISLIFLLISVSEASNIKNSATVFMYHKFGVSKYPSTSVTINQLENHVLELTKEKYTLYKRIKVLVDENNLLKWAADEHFANERMNIIVQNGNTGEHYEIVDEQDRNK